VCLGGWRLQPAAVERAATAGAAPPGWPGDLRSAGTETGWGLLLDEPDEEEVR